MSAAYDHIDLETVCMSSDYIFTSESVSEGHPDKMADQISDAVLDAILKQDTKARVACETLVKTGLVVVAGEITTSAWVDLEDLVRKTVCEIGYNSSDVGFDGDTCAVLNGIGKQSPEIAMGVDRSAPEEQGAGDQGLMFGYANNETDVLMPAPITYSHRLVEQQSKMRRDGTLEWLRPDAKSQVTLRYQDGKPVGLEAVVLSTQHNPEISLKDLREAVIEHVLKPVLPTKWLEECKDEKLLLIHTVVWHVTVAVHFQAKTHQKWIVQRPMRAVMLQRTLLRQVLLIGVKYRSLMR